jgi:hypothetical protein
MTTNNSQFDSLFADEFQCPYCEEPFKCQRIRKHNPNESMFRISRRKLVEAHLEQYHSDKPGMPNE